MHICHVIIKHLGAYFFETQCCALYLKEIGPDAVELWPKDGFGIFATIFDVIVDRSSFNMQRDDGGTVDEHFGLSLK